MTYCVVGAGAAGLAAAHYLKAAGIPFEVLERERDVGALHGAWGGARLAWPSPPPAFDHDAIP